MDVMVDLETLGSTPGSIILSIGAVAFSSGTNMGAWPTFYTVISTESSELFDLTKDEDTIAWWNRQSPEARMVLADAGESDSPGLPIALSDFNGFLRAQCRNYKDIRLWGNGADFDNVLLCSAFRAANMKPHWSYAGHRCFRTLRNLFPDLAQVQFPPGKTAHHALDDALAQAVAADRVLQHIAKSQPVFDPALLTPILAPTGV